MCLRWGSDRNQIHLIQQISPIAKDLAVVILADLLKRFSAYIACTREFDPSFAGKFGVIACVMAAKTANSDRRAPKFHVFCHNLKTSRFSAILYIFIEDGGNYKGHLQLA
jgi:hypothetical protein